MTATDELRRLLDERGVKWWQSANTLGCVFTRWYSPLFGDEVCAMENGEEGLVLFDHFVTPEQAVAATLGIALDESQLVKLPVSEDGDVLHIGELVDEKLPFGGYAAPAPIDTMELSRGASGYVWMVKLDAKNRALVSPKLLRHHEPTVEDVLQEMLEQAVGYSDAHTTVALNAIAEYSAKLRLAGEGE